MIPQTITTKYISIDPKQPEKDMILLKEGAKVLVNGGLVAFPTETVYGLGANAYDKEAISRIYAAKGRPGDNPLILHLPDVGQVADMVEEISEIAQLLMDTFWPGPLTLLFKKNSKTPTAALAQLTTVGIRVPDNKVAQLLLKAAAVPIAAPSANSSGKPSPTRASHVLYDLDGKIDLIIDGGHCEYGLESTIVDVSTSTPCLLRPGSITLDMLESVIGEMQVDPTILKRSSDDIKMKNIPPKAPGMKYTHYSPKADVRIVTGDIPHIIEKAKELVALYILKNPDKKIGILATEQTKNAYEGLPITVLSIGDRNDLSEIARNLFKYLRKVDYLGIDIVIAEGVDESELGLAIMNRLKKAAGYSIFN